MEKSSENSIRVSLNEELSKDLEDIKKYHGIKADAEALRLIIREYKKEIMKREDFDILVRKAKK